MAVQLSKGQTISLAKNDGGELSKVRMGLGWDPITKKTFFGGTKQVDVDLDASCLVFDAAGELIDEVWFGQLQSRCGAIVHTGDNRTGAGDGDDESIRVDLSRLNSEATTLVFTVNSFLEGQSFNDVTNASCRLVDESSGKDIASYTLSQQGNHTAQIMAKVSRKSGKWEMTALGIAAHGRTFHDLMPVIRPQI